MLSFILNVMGFILNVMGVIFMWLAFRLREEIPSKGFLEDFKDATFWIFIMLASLGISFIKM